MFIAINISAFEMEFAVLSDDGKITSKFSVSTQNRKTSDQYISEIKNVFDYLKINKDEITYASMLSTVPKFNYIVCDFLKDYIKIEPIIICNNMIPLPAKEANIEAIPVDILAGCYSCSKHYGDNVIFINFDAIITFGVCVNNEFLGYVVFPGLDLLANVVHEENSDFPEILIKQTREIFANEKYSALNCGVFNGAMGACDNIINNILEEYENKQFKVVATCKKPELLQYSKTINIIDQDLRIKSIVEIAKHNLLSL